MRLLLDANLSYRLVKKLSDTFPDCLHVSRAGLGLAPKDSEIWAWAREHDYTFVVTNDEDFLQLVDRLGFPPKVVLLRTGNQSTNFLADLIKKHQADLLDLEQSSEIGLLEIF